MPNLDQGPQLLAEQGGRILPAEDIQLHREAAASGEGHFAEGREQPAVRSVVVGEDQAFSVELLHRGEETPEQPGIVQIRTLLAHLAVDLGQARGPQPVAPAA